MARPRPHLPRLRWLLCAVGAGLAGQAAAAGHGPASYERWLAPVGLNPTEEQALTVVRQFARGHKLRFRLDRRLIRAARAVAAAHAAESTAAVNPEAARLEAQRWGWTDGQLALVLARPSDPSSLAKVLRQQLEQELAGLELNRVGVGATLVGRQRLVVLLFSRRLVNLLPTPAQMEPEALLRSTGSLPPAVADLALNLQLVVQLPSGQTVRPPVDRQQRRFAGQVPLGNQAGLANVQWLVDRGRGPEIAALFPVTVGSGGPTPPLVTSKVVTDSDEDPTGTLTGLILGAREAEAESLPMYSAALAELARLHAEEMRDRGFFAHVSPTTGDLDQRLRSRGIGFVRAVENLAIADSAGSAFQQWMHSPAHRANLLDPQSTALGVGLAESHDTNGSSRWHAVAVLARFADDGNEEELRRQALTSLNARRRALRLPPLRRDPALEMLASRHSRESAWLGELTEVSPIRGRLIDTVFDEEEVTAAAADVFLAGTMDVVIGSPHVGEPFTRVGIGVHRDRQRAGAQLWVSVIFVRD